ncbi:hypothetical protein HYC85_003576 [Camellia sinensis]|uniref:Uncharacterized protein n=1 Tax=Camellia sinensis TaxID=4442 RepID=A0A7J7HVU1_CAMSI|nr:hypothetical protein HYC85_003576 [Camellia sinensis]
MPITNSSPDRHVAVLVFPFSSHPALIFGLVRRLATAAPDVTFSFYSTAKSIQCLLSPWLIPENIKACHFSDGVPDGYVFVGKHQEDINLFLNVNVYAVAEENFKRAMVVAEEETGQRISCLVADAFLWFSGDMAKEMRVPWVLLWTSAACSLSTHCYTDLIRETVGIHGMKIKRCLQRERLVAFLKDFKKYFARSCEDLCGITLEIVHPRIAPSLEIQPLCSQNLELGFRMFNSQPQCKARVARFETPVKLGAKKSDVLEEPRMDHSANQ